MERNEELEAMVDRYGLDNVVSALVDICHAKAEHVGSVWQDWRLADAWCVNAKRLDRVSLKPTGL